MKPTKRTILLILGFAAASAIVGPFLPTYYVGLLSQSLIFAIFAMSLDVLVGYAGLPSLGHRGQVIAALGSALPVSEHSEDREREVVAQVRECAESISKSMGYQAASIPI